MGQLARLVFRMGGMGMGMMMMMMQMMRMMVMMMDMTREKTGFANEERKKTKRVITHTNLPIKPHLPKHRRLNFVSIRQHLLRKCLIPAL